ncbi:MAG TPA: R3H domain-containing nucleic acid-binding protein [Bryobacteraceae bacterium]|nr:R3H domain-containing nucleic acid-binding protein [Bryobacteraceae bacterium]
MTQKKYTVELVQPRISAFLDTVLNGARLNVKYVVEEGDARHPDFENPDIVVKFTGPDVDLLLENKAELLLALEQLTMEVLHIPLEEHARICFDANDYRMLRIEELRLSAVTAADKVRRTGTPFRFNPMNSRERRIIHLALRNEAAVRSESAGIGPGRQVVIYPAGMATPPEMAQMAMAPPRPSGPPRRSGPPRGGPRRRG